MDIKYKESKPKTYVFKSEQNLIKKLKKGQIFQPIGMKVQYLMFADSKKIVKLFKYFDEQTGFDALGIQVSGNKVEIEDWTENTEWERVELDYSDKEWNYIKTFVFPRTTN